MQLHRGTNTEGRGRSLKRAIAACAFTVLLASAACQSAPRPATVNFDAKAPIACLPEPGWKLADVPAEPFAIPLPPSWQQFNTDPASIDALIKGASARDKEIGAMLQQRKDLISSEVRFLAFDVAAPARSDLYRTNLTVMHLAKRETSLASLAEQMAAAIEKLPGLSGPVTRKTVVFGTREVGQISFGATAGALKLAGTYYLLPSGTEIYAMTFGVRAEESQAYAPTFEKIARCFGVG